MSLLSAYQRTPNYLAIPLALVCSAVIALMLATLVVIGKLFLLQTLDGQGAGDLGVAILLVFFATPATAILGFVLCFSILINWHHSASWRVPTFAFVLSSISVWAWARDFGGIGILPFIPGAIAGLISCWLLRRSSGSPSDHVLEA
jgi:hypothetical protein